MRTPRSGSNVYVLPRPLVAAEAPAVRARRPLPLRLRWVAWWWRLRLTVREVIDALRRFGRPGSRVPSDELGRDFETVIMPPPRRAAGPAQVIEFAAARRRRAAR